MSVVAQRYGYSVQYEVLNDKVGEAFAAAVNEADLRVAGQPRSPKGRRSRRRSPIRSRVRSHA
jgi:FKBP-type peptidyl-prolyl cis-trans isomerase (trigger factor)